MKGNTSNALEHTMTLQDATRTATVRARHLKLPTCPLCGDTLLAPMLAEHVNERVVHNHWACESCGHTFRKSFEFATRIERAPCVCDA